MNQKEANQKILELMNKDDLSKEEIQLFKEIMFQCDLKIQGKYRHTPLMYAFDYNQSQNLNLSEEQIDYLIKKSDLTQKNEDGYTTLMYALKFNKTEYLNIKQEQFDYLIQHSNLKQQNKEGDTPLMYALSNNKSENLNINEEQWDYLIKNSDLKQQNIDGWTPLMIALYFNKKQDLQLSSKQFKTMYAALDEEQKQNTFQNLIQENFENNQQYLEEINLLLYDLKFKSNEKTRNWLKEENYQDIIQMIEKRDMFFQLNKEVKLIDNHQKIDKIKL